MDEKLEYLLSVGVKVEDVIKHPSCLLKPITHLKERVEFVKAEKPEVLSNRSLDDVMLSKNELFANEVCGSTLENYTEFVQSLNKEFVKAGKKK